MRGRVCVVAPPVHRRTGRQHAGIRGGLAGLQMGENLFYISLANHRCRLERREVRAHLRKPVLQFHIHQRKIKALVFVSYEAPVRSSTYEGGRVAAHLLA